MPSKDTKVIASRIPKSDYYKFVKVASENQMPVGTFLTAMLKLVAAKIEMHKTIDIKDNIDFDIDKIVKESKRTSELLMKGYRSEPE